MKKPELLLPVGNIESFYAAIKGGADAIYVGLKSFNARARASNFNPFQFQLLINEAAKNHIKVYVTLNTVIKNKEVPELIDALWFLTKLQVDGIIIQDWGTFFIVKKHFPRMAIHASTQMANHNSTGTAYSNKMGFKRVILARELTLPELTAIQKKSKIETEVFVHGALCYSFSGMCSFSSYLGGNGANRGFCTQPCRRFYKDNQTKQTAFSMKDNQLIEMVPDIAESGVSSLKVEGRLKSGEYVYQVARAYKKVLNDPSQLNEAKKLLEQDMGREKTQWFYAKQTNSPLSEFPNTGILIGKVVAIDHNTITFRSEIKPEKGSRLRFKIHDDIEQIPFIVENFQLSDENNITVKGTINGLRKGNEVYLAGLRKEKFPTKLKGNVKPVNPMAPAKIRSEIRNNIRKFNIGQKPNLYVRIDSLEWLSYIATKDISQIILHLNKTNLSQLNFKETDLTKNKQKIWLELPQFIPEKDIDFYKHLLVKAASNRFNQFVLSHLSQKELLPAGSVFGTNENVYCFNDAAAQLLKIEGAQWVTSPFENEYENLLTGAKRDQVIPLYFHPKLFYSRQPVKIGKQTFRDEQQHEFRKVIENGITQVIPVNPVSILQYKNKLSQKGFNQFMIDLSFEIPSVQKFAQLLKKFKLSEASQPSTSFNFKKGLK